MNINRKYSDPDSESQGNHFFQRRGDLRVRQLLQELDLNYNVDGSTGNFFVPFENDTGQTVVVINSETQNAVELETRAVWKVVCVFEEAPERDQANALLLHNAQIPFGKWQLYPVEDGVLALIFVMEVPAEVTSNQLQRVIAATLGAPAFE